jgi:hypothetical protein
MIREPLFDGSPVQALVAVPVVLRGGDDPRQLEAGVREASSRHRERDELLRVDGVRKRPHPPERLADRNVGAVGHDGPERRRRVGDRPPHERRAEAEGGVVGIRLELNLRRVGGLDLDHRVEPGRGCLLPRLLREHRPYLDAVHPAPVRRREDARRPALAARDVEHARSVVEPHVVADEADLLRARRVLELMVALGDLPRPRHPRHPSPPR